MPRYAITLFFALITYSATLLAQAYRPPNATPAAAVDFDSGSVEALALALTPDVRMGEKGYMPSGRWVKIAQNDLDACFTEARKEARKVSAQQPDAATAGAKGFAPVLGTDKQINIQINFDNNRYEPTDAAQIKKMAAVLSQPSTVRQRYVIEGHANAEPVPSARASQLNRDISCLRAARIRELLRSRHGINGDRLLAVGYGDTQPLTPNNPSDGINRRVVLRLIAQ